MTFVNLYANNKSLKLQMSRSGELLQIRSLEKGSYLKK